MTGKSGPRRRGERLAAGGAARHPGSGDPVDGPIPEHGPHWIPNAVREQLDDTSLSLAVAEATRLRGQLAAYWRDRLQLVYRLRALGVGWAGVGWFFGLTGEAVRQQYASVVADLMEAQR